MSHDVHYVPSLAPIHFFRLHVDINHGTRSSSKLLSKRFILPDTSGFLGEDTFADVGSAWDDSGLYLHVHAHKKFEEAVYPKFVEGDALELFVDTRDIKEAGCPSRFCHHFLILPQEVQGVRALELSRFRAEDSHPLCENNAIEVTFHEGSRDYFLDIYLPADILHGYDPHAFDRLGLTYTVHRFRGKPQNFSVSSNFVNIAQNPSLWASCRLKI